MIGPDLSAEEHLEWNLWCHVLDSSEMPCWQLKVLLWARQEYLCQKHAQMTLQELEDNDRNDARRFKGL